MLLFYFGYADDNSLPYNAFNALSRSRALAICLRHDIFAGGKCDIFSFWKMRYDINPLTPSGISLREAEYRFPKGNIANSVRDLYRWAALPPMVSPAVFHMPGLDYRGLGVFQLPVIFLFFFFFQPYPSLCPYFVIPFWKYSWYSKKNCAT